MTNDQTAGVITRDRSEPDGARNRIASLREAMAAWQDVCAAWDEQGRSEAVVGTADEVTAAAEVLQRSLVDAIDRVGEADLAAARERGWLTADEANTALKEKRLRELAKVRANRTYRERYEKQRDR